MTAGWLLGLTYYTTCWNWQPVCNPMKQPSPCNTETSIQLNACLIDRKIWQFAPNAIRHILKQCIPAT